MAKSRCLSLHHGDYISPSLSNVLCSSTPSINTSEQGHKILILGGGIAGLATALSLIRFSPPCLRPKIDVFEIRPQPGTIGGAMSLAPHGLRVLDHLGVYDIIKRRNYGIEVNAMEFISIYHRDRLAKLDFRGPNDEGIGNPPYKGLRITRAQLIEALLEALREITDVTLHFGMRANNIQETADTVTVSFDDSTTAAGGLLLGCDGVHSFTRTHHVEPGRKQIYSGVSNAFGCAPLDKDQPLHFETSALNFARRGLLLTSLYVSTRSSGYVGALVSVTDVGSRDGWKAKSADVAALKADMLDRFGDSVHPAVQTMIQRGEGWFLWPVYMLPNGGRWATNRTMLLGDAAHAMPPQGESTSVLLENAVIFARCLFKTQVIGGNIKAGFNAFEDLRRGRVDAAFKESQNVVGQVKDSGPLGFALKTWIIPVAFKLGLAANVDYFKADAAIMPLGFGDEVASSASALTLLKGGIHRRFGKVFEAVWCYLQIIWRQKKAAQHKD